MYEKIGIVTNIWAQRMDQGDSFIDLVQQFGQNGFTQFEVRDGDYLRQSIFGDFLEKLKDVMGNYNTEEWEEICRSIWQSTEKKNLSANTNYYSNNLEISPQKSSLFG